jgi:RNA polymerase sigma factor (sigma-70 family)
VDEHEFTALYEQMSSRVFSFAARRLSRQAADDTVSQTFETVWSKRDECPGNPDARVGWVFTIGRFKVLQESERQRRRHHDHRFAEDYSARPALQPDVADAVTETALGHWIYQQLTAVERELFDVAFMLDVTSEQAAAMLAVSLGTFYTRVSRLRSRITSLQDSADTSEIRVGGETA